MSRCDPAESRVFMQVNILKFFFYSSEKEVVRPVFQVGSILLAAVVYWR